MQIAGLVPQEVREGLRIAMRVGTPQEVQLRPRFWVPDLSQGEEGAPSSDAEDIPFDPAVPKPQEAGRFVEDVLCACGYQDRPGVQLDWGVVLPARVTITILDEEYELVKDFSWVQLGGERFNYRSEMLPLGLGDVTVHQFSVVAEDKS